jgi:Omp85 superfamily domain
MFRVRAPLALLLVFGSLGALPALAQEKPVSEASPETAALDGGAGGPTLESERTHLLKFTPVRAVGPPCTSSLQCADALGYGEVCTDGKCQEYEDETDIFTALHMTQKGAVAPKAYQLLPSILPVIGVNPALGVLLGVTAFMAMYVGDPETTTISNAQPTIIYTSHNQFVVQMISTIMTSGNEYELQGDWRFLLYNQDTYGLGTGPYPVNTGFTLNGYGQTAAVNGAQPMDWDLLRFHQSVLKKVSGPLYVGGAVRFDRYYNIDDELLNLSSTPAVITSHYAYSRYYGFNSNQYNIVSLGAEVLYDSRDSTVNPYRGVYANFVFRGDPTWLGSSKDSTQGYAEFRTYVGLDPEIPRNVLAFWVIAQGVTSGALPYLALPAIGWDSRGRTGRGYVAGRLRGTEEIYLESELRFRITDNGFIGGVVFANVSTFARPAVSIAGYSNPGQHLFENLAPAGGVGLRIMMNRASRTNVTVDFAFSPTGFGVYLGGGEAF